MKWVPCISRDPTCGICGTFHADRDEQSGQGQGRKPHQHGTSDSEARSPSRMTSIDGGLRVDSRVGGEQLGAEKPGVRLHPPFDAELRGGIRRAEHLAAMAAVEEIVSSRPERRLRITGRTARVTFIGPNSSVSARFVESFRSAAGRLMSFRTRSSRSIRQMCVNRAAGCKESV